MFICPVVDRFTVASVTNVGFTQLVPGSIFVNPAPSAVIKSIISCILAPAKVILSALPGVPLVSCVLVLPAVFVTSVSAMTCCITSFSLTYDASVSSFLPEPYCAIAPTKYATAALNVSKLPPYVRS